MCWAPAVNWAAAALSARLVPVPTCCTAWYRTASCAAAPVTVKLAASVVMLAAWAMARSVNAPHLARPGPRRSGLPQRCPG